MKSERKNNVPVGFIEEMEAKLKQNEGKGGWSDESIDALFEFLALEIQELSSAMKYIKSAIKTGMYVEEAIISAQQECADVGNFSMMIWDVLQDARERRQAFKEALKEVLINQTIGCDDES